MLDINYAHLAKIVLLRCNFQGKMIENLMEFSK